jgi:hypothetical protein
MRILKPVMAAALAGSMTGCAGMSDLCNNQPLICAAIGVAAIAGVVVASGIFEGAPDPPPGGAPEASDARLKRDVRPIGRLSNGMPLYAFRYWNDDRIFTGVLAQELLADPRFRHAVSRGQGGYYVVDLAALGLAISGDAAQFRDAGRNAVAAAPPLADAEP